MNPSRLTLIALAACLPLTAAADTLVLTNGGKIEGKLVARKDGKIHFDTAHGVAVFDAKQVKDVVTGKTDVDLFAEKRDALAFTDARGHYDLARWCHERGMVAQMRSQLERVLQIDPEHKAAHIALGHVHHDGAWLVGDEQIRAAGYTEYLGRWYTTDQLAKLGGKSTAKQQAHDDLRRTINGLLKTMSGGDDRKRKQARDELMVLSRVQNMPQLAKLAGKLYKRYEAYHAHRRYVTLEVRAQRAEVEIDTVTSTIGSGAGTLPDPDDPTTDPSVTGNPAVVTIDVPQVRLIDLRTTVTVPAGSGRR